MDQQKIVVYNRVSQWANRGGLCTIVIASGPLEDSSVT